MPKPRQIGRLNYNGTMEKVIFAPKINWYGAPIGEIQYCKRAGKVCPETTCTNRTPKGSCEIIILQNDVFYIPLKNNTRDVNQDAMNYSIFGKQRPLVLTPFKTTKDSGYEPIDFDGNPAKLKKRPDEKKMTKINIISQQGKENYNKYLYNQSEFRSIEYTLLKGEAVLFSTKDQKCCWCDAKPIVSKYSCQHCLDVMKDQNAIAIKDNNVLVIEHHDIATEFNAEKVEPYNIDATYLLRCNTITTGITERKSKTQTVLNALADECGSELPADFESRMQRIIAETKDGKENCCLESILYAVQTLGATPQQTRIRLNIWSNELKRLFEDKVAEPPMADVGTKKQSD